VAATSGHNSALLIGFSLLNSLHRAAGLRTVDSETGLQNWVKKDARGSVGLFTTLANFSSVIY
jgi:hypothetical protein